MCHARCRSPLRGCLWALPLALSFSHRVEAAARWGGSTRAFVPSKRRGQAKFFIFITTDQ